MGGAIKADISLIGEREVIERLEKSLELAREGDDRRREAFKRLDIDVRDKELGGEELLKRAMRAGESLDEREQEEVHNILIGDVERLEKRDG